MLCFVFAALIVLLDQFFKHWIILALPLYEDKVLIPGFLKLTHIENTGAAFSMLSNQRWLLAAIALVAAFILIMILLRYNEGFWGTLGLSAVLGGTVGNLIDRAFYGHVVDMFEPVFIKFAIFNIADIFITLGGITFCIFFIIMSFKSPRSDERSLVSEPESYDEELEDEYDYTGDLYDDDPDTVSDTKVIPPLRRPSDHVSNTNRYTAGQEPEEYYEAEPEQENYFETEQEQEDYIETEQEQPGRYEFEPAQAEYHESLPEPQTDVASALDSFESELGTIDDYDVDALLREYGFENDTDKL